MTIDRSDGAARITHARGDADDVFSAGFVCPKGASLPGLDNDPDRLSRPLIRRDGVLVEASWTRRSMPSPPASVASSPPMEGRQSVSTLAIRMRTPSPERCTRP